MSTLALVSMLDGDTGDPDDLSLLISLWRTPSNLFTAVVHCVTATYYKVTNEHGMFFNIHG